MTGNDWENRSDKNLAELVQRLQNVLGAELVSVVLYGSAAAGDWDESSSDLNVLCVFGQLTPQELRLATPVAQWWKKIGNPAPLLMTAEELQTSTDCFPIEFSDMKQHRRVLYGPDPIKELEIDRKFYRAQIEHQLRAKMIRLRQRAAELLAERDRLYSLMADSLSTFCVLGRHALILGGHEPRWTKQEVLDALSRAIGKPFAASNEILAIRTSAKRATADFGTLFGEYLKEIEALVRYVDGVDANPTEAQVESQEKT